MTADKSSSFNGYQRMAKGMKIAAALSLVATVVFAYLYESTSYEILLSLAITFGTAAYHLLMRLSAGLMFDIIMKNKADLNSKWYRVSSREMEIYKKLKVHGLKSKMPTYDSSLFDPKIHSLREIACATCQAELVHETIAVLSFLPIVAGVWFGAFPVFIITSVLSASFDMIFVIMQRYNRQRIMQLLSRKEH